MADADKQTAGIGRASALMASGSMVSRVLGIVRNAMLVFCVGALTPASTAFNTANTLPNQIFALLQGGILTAILIPQITKAMRREDSGREAIDALLTAAFVVVGAITLLAMALTAPLVTLLQLRDETRLLGIAFAYLCLPQIFFYGAYAIWQQVLNARGYFGITMWTTVFANLVQIAGMGLFLWRYGYTTQASGWDPAMVWLLAGTFTLGVAVQAGALIPALIKSGHSWRISFKLRGHGFRSAAKLAVWAIVAVVFAQAGGFITTAAINAVDTRAHAAHESVANITSYYQAFQMFMVPHGIITVSILTAIFPRLARAYQADDRAALRADVTQALRTPILIMVPVSALAIAVAAPGMATLSPGMTPHEVDATALVFSIMVVGLVPYAVSGLQQRYSMAREDGRTNLWFTLIVVGVQIAAAAAILVLPNAAGVPVVALGQTVGNTLAALVFLTLAQRQLGGLPLRSLAALIVRLIAASSIPGVAAWFAARTVVDLMGAGDPEVSVKVRLVGNLVATCAGAAVFALLFLVFAKIVRVTEVTEVLGRLVRRFR